MNHNLIDLLVCPLCKGQLQHDKANQRLICRFDRLAFAVRDGVPIMLIDQAETIDLDELKKTSPVNFENAEASHSDQNQPLHE
jgi:uncharacterized protein